MSSLIKYIPAVFFYFGIIACSGGSTLKEINISGQAQGTTYSIKYYANDSSVYTQADAEFLFKHINLSLSLYEPASLINKFNQSDTGVTMDLAMQMVVNESMRISRRTEGLSDMTVFPLVQFWGFGVNKITAEPDTTLIPNLLQCVGQNLISVKGRQLRKKKPCVKIDLNGIAQGFTVDMIAQALESKGVENFLVEVGGEIRVKGKKLPGNKPMEIGIESPADLESEEFVIRRVIRPGEGAVTTSGNFHKYYESKGRIITHLIDPRTGYTINNELISVTVFAQDAMTADGYDNALMVMGLNKSFAFIEKYQNLEAYFIYKKPDGTIADTATKGFYALMK